MSNVTEKPSTIPPDDLSRDITVARPNEDTSLPHIGLVGDTYTILISGKQTAGKYCLIDMHVPSGGGPPPHRHDFEELFSVLEGEIEVTFRGKTSMLKAGQSANVPANAPHQFRNVGSVPARLLCACMPAGQEVFFAEMGEPVAGRTTPPPKPDAAAMAAAKTRAEQLAPRYRSEFV